MLSYALAIAVAISSLVLFLTAFVMSDVHRRDDFLWSGVGLLYALVLWFCARNITGAVLLGQAAATALLVSYSWQTLKLRKAIAHPDKAAEIANFSILQKVNSLWQRNRTPVTPTNTAETPITPKVTEQEIAIPDTVANNTVKETAVKNDDTESPTVSSTTDASKPSSDSASVTQTANVTDKTTQVPTIEPQQTTESKPIIETVDTESPITKNTADENKTSSDSPSITQTAEPTDKTIQVPVTKLKQTEESNPTIKIAPESPTVEGTAKENKVSSDSQPKTQPAEFTDKTTQVPTTKLQQTSESNSSTTSDAPEGERPQIKEAIQEDLDRPVVPQTIESNAVMPTETENLSDAATEEEKRSQTTDLKIEPVSETTASETKPGSKTSQLDSLETVEVAEVLEASTDERTLDSNSERDNIIEVTTTEINITTEVKKIESESEKDWET